MAMAGGMVGSPDLSEPEGSLPRQTPPDEETEGIRAVFLPSPRINPDPPWVHPG